MFKFFLTDKKPLYTNVEPSMSDLKLLNDFPLFNLFNELVLGSIVDVLPLGFLKCSTPLRLKTPSGNFINFIILH